MQVLVYYPYLGHDYFHILSSSLSFYLSLLKSITSASIVK